MPLFTTPLKDSKLDETDAEFVDVLHTDALKEGKVETCGHVDFYVNGGIEQPGCKSGNILGEIIFTFVSYKIFILVPETRISNFRY